MVAGDASRTTYDSAISANKAVQYVCLDKDGDTETPGRFEIPDRADIRLPNKEVLGWFARGYLLPKLLVSLEMPRCL
jgi:hypothetical protein